MLSKLFPRREVCADVDAAERVDQLECLLELTAILNRPEPPETTLVEALDTLVRRVGISRAVVREPDEDDTLRVLAVSGTFMAAHPPSDIRGNGSDAWKSYTGACIVLDNNHTPGGRSGRTIKQGGNRSTLALPLVVSGRCRGPAPGFHPQGVLHA